MLGLYEETRSGRRERKTSADNLSTSSIRRHKRSKGGGEIKEKPKESDIILM